jgi:hypothetical protein
MTAHQIVHEYHTAARLFSMFGYVTKRAGRPIEFVSEADMRLRQLHYLLQRFVTLEEEHRASVKAEALRDLKADDRLADAERQSAPSERAAALELHGEAFYYFAWRMRSVLRKIKGFAAFEAVGVRDVRNHLIEHADKTTGVAPRTFTVDCPEGLILKPFGRDAGRRSDKGLYPNAEEFIGKLLPRLRRALDAAKSLDADKG